MSRKCCLYNNISVNGETFASSRITTLNCRPVKWRATSLPVPYAVVSRGTSAAYIKASIRTIDYHGRFPLLRILNTTTSMLFGRVMELSTKYPQRTMVVVFRIRNKGNRLFECTKQLASTARPIDILYYR